VVRLSVTLRTRFMHLPYGDQALFVQTQTFRHAKFLLAIPPDDSFHHRIPLRDYSS